MNVSPNSALPVQFAWLQALQEPLICSAWSASQWDHVLRLSRRLRLLPRLALAVDRAGLTGSMPVPVQRQLLAARRLSAWRTQSLLWALERVGRTLDGLQAPRVLLKGAAYIGQQLPIAEGRLPSDADVLVPHAHLGDAQQRLLNHGWQELELDTHDQRYYRDWTHEVPPMRHPVLVMELDLHHAILPPVARVRVDTGLLLQRLQPSGLPGWQVLHPVDQVLHCAVHLFHDSEIRDRLRDLVDLDGLLRHFGSVPGFWDELPGRAAILGLGEPLALACHLCTRWLATPVPSQALARVARQGLGPWRRAWLLPMLEALLTPAPLDRAASRAQGFAAMLFLVRYHRNRMPLQVLVPHLWHKSRRQRQAAEAAATPGQARPPAR